MNYKYLVFGVISLLFLRCNSSTEPTPLSKEEISSLNFKKHKKSQKKLLVAKYNIKYDWDTLRYKYSIQYEPVIKSKYQIISRLLINDIYKRDETYYLRVSCHQHYYFIIKTNDLSKLTPLLNKLKTQRRYNSFLLIVDIMDIKKSLFELTPSYEFDFGDEANIEIDLPTTFIGTGDLIEIKILE